MRKVQLFFSLTMLSLLSPLTSVSGALVPLEYLETTKSTNIDINPTSGNDDVEELADGTIYVNSSDLELGYDGGSKQTVAIRFKDVSIPMGATIINAYIQFQVDESNSSPSSLIISAQSSDDAEPFDTSINNVTSRLQTEASVH